jgi:23S rRNA pseudouridine1911/1915/1917 synthase
MRLDKFIAEKVDVSRSRIQKAIKDGLVLVNGEKVTEPDFKVSPNDRIELPEFEPNKLKAISLELRVVYENDDIAVIDKPAGLMVHPAAGRDDDTLANALLARFPKIKDVGDPHRPGIVHRLDEDTSGLLLIAKNQKALDYYKKLFQSREIEKEYFALVHGLPKMHGMINEPIGKTSTHQKMRVGTGKESKTEYKLLVSDKALQFSLIQVRLHTGRTHQIRVHMSHIGHPVVGDKIYGKRPALHASQLAGVTGRQFLHAHRLKFKMQDGTWLELTSELPEDLKNVLVKLKISYN